ncbi:hypothetical protein EMPS_00337 [Entomortierella parvispora]|uniref:Tail specific protease domain-containing protein n=1 Tax=Entomortierella parvispora TaxID=205924 RepID=A0A9P3LRD8_9FUNG|nr:hypothetical protein EMPS_00337 [Entomortierella parvispora]
MSRSPRNFALAAAVALATVFFSAESLPLGRRAVDACGILGGLNSTQIRLVDVANCYNAIPFDHSIASSTFETVYKLFDEMYVFRDSALTPDLPLPFTSAPVDIIKDLQTIGRTHYDGDYGFHRDIALAISSLNDAHASYSVDCYSLYTFAQPMGLYAPVIDGKQTIRVYKDWLKRGYDDCEVITIDGQPALTYLFDWATKYTSFSKDGGVRLTQSLASQVYDLTSNSFVILAGEFSQRTTLPENGAIEYKLQCSTQGSSSTTTTTIRDVWKVFSSVSGNFTDVTSFVAQNCAKKPDPKGSTSSSDRADDYNPYHPHYVPMPPKSVMSEHYGDSDLSTNTAITNAAPSSSSPIPPPQEFEGAEKLGSGNATVFYQLKSQPDVGVIVVWTHVAPDDELDVILHYMDEFHKRNITHILFDFQGNGGGSVDFASALVQLFFPSQRPLDQSLYSDLKVTPDIQTLSKVAFNNSNGGLYNAAQYVNLKLSETATEFTLYQNDDLFTDVVDTTKNGRTASYTQKTTLEPVVLNGLPDVSHYPWTGNAAQFRILSDGRCGSACLLSAFELHNDYKVEAFSIGGVQGQALSIFSFAGGAVGTLSSLEQTFEAIHATTVENGRLVGPLPYAGDVRLPILEVFAPGSETVPLEYDAKVYKADVHLDFDPLNARSRDVMWTQVAAAAWS